MLDELKAHLEEMLRSFRSGVAVYEEHLVEALAKLAGAQDKLDQHAAEVVANIQANIDDKAGCVAEIAKNVAQTTGETEVGTDTTTTAEKTEVPVQTAGFEGVASAENPAPAASTDTTTTAEPAQAAGVDAEPDQTEVKA